jgi:hypothetical protein
MLHTRTSKVLPFLVLASVLPTFAQTTTFGGRGIYRVFSARNIQGGSIITNLHLSAFLRNGNNSGRVDDTSILLGLTYGIRDDVELTAQISPYRDDQVRYWGGIGDTQLGLNWHLPVRASHFDFGIRAFFWLPTDDRQNIDHSEDAVSWSISGIVSSEFGNVDGSHPVKLDLNLGYWDHDIGTFLSEQSSDQVILGLGYKVPLPPFIYFGEYTAEIFMDNDFDSRENAMCLTQGVRFKVPFGIWADAGLDYSLGKNPRPLLLADEFSRWKVFLGISYHFATGRVPARPAYRDTETITSKDAETFEQIERRKGVEKELKEVRDALDAPVEDEGKAEKP